MIRIAFNLGRTTHVTLDQHGLSHPRERNRGGEEQRAARHHVFRLAHVGDDRLWRLFRARADARERE